MNKKIITIIILLVCVIGVLAFFILNNKSANTKESGNNSIENNELENNTKLSNGKVLVVYFSATNNTRNVAEKIGENLDADLFEIEPANEYTSEDLDWTNENSRVSKEHNDASLRNVELKNTNVDNWDNYDTVLIGYPIWWGIAAWPVDTFVKNNDFTGKTVIPFCTSASSGLGESGKLLEEEAGTGSWQEGHRFSSGVSNSDIKSFKDSLK